MKFEDYITDEDLVRVLPVLRESESKTSKDINKQGFVGSYQMGAAALEDTGFLKKGASKKGNEALKNPNNWNIEGGLDTFLNDEKLQVKAAAGFMRQNFGYMAAKNKINPNMSKREIMGKLFAAHLGGWSNVDKSFQDANGVSVKSYDTMGQMAYDGKTVKRQGNRVIAHDWNDLNDRYIPQVDDVKPLGVTFGQVAGATAMRETPIGSTVSKAAVEIGLQTSNGIQEDFDPFEGVDPVEQPGLYPMLLDAENAEQKQKIVNYYNMQNENKNILERATIGQRIATLPIAIAGDPLTYIPLIGASKALLKAGKLAGAAIGAGVGASSAAVSEGFLMASQDNRDISESVGAIAFGAALGGVFGGVLAKGTKSINSISDSKLISDDTLKSIGAAENPESVRAMISEKGNEILKDNLLFEKFIDTGEFKNTPAMRLLNSENPEIATLTRGLVRTNLQSVKNAEGIASKLDIEGKIYIAKAVSSNKFKNFMVDYGIEVKQNKLNKTIAEFDSELSDHLARGTRADTKAMNKAIDYYRSEMEMYKNDLFRIGAFKDIDKLPKNYNMTLYNFEAIRNNPVEFNNMLKKNLTPSILERSGYKVDDYLNKPDIKRMIDIEVQEAVEKLGKKLTTDARNQVSDIDFIPTSAKSANTKRKLLHLPYEDIKPFLEPSMEARMQTYIQRAELEIGTFDTYGTINLDEVKSTARNNAEVRYEKKFGDDLVKKNEALRKFEEELKDWDEMFKRVKGESRSASDSAAVNEVTRWALAANFTRLLGSVNLTMLNEGGKILTLKAFGWATPQFTALGNTIKKVNLTKAQIQSYGIGGDFDKLRYNLRVDDNVNAYLAESSLSGKGLKDFNKGAYYREKIVKGFSLVSAIPAMDDFLRRLSFNGAMDFYLPRLQRLADGDYHLPDGSINPKHKKVVTELARFGYDKNNVQDLVKTIREKGVNPDNWGTAGDDYLKRIALEIDNIIIRPTAGDKYLWADGSNIGLLVSQFKGFSQGAFNKFLAAGLQRNDAFFWTQFYATLLTTYAVNEIKDIAFKRDDKEIGTKILRAIDMSGTIPVLGDVSFLGANVLGMTSTRYHPPNLTQLLGPTAAGAEDILKITSAVINDKGNADTLRRFKSLFPGNNLLPLQATYEHLRDK